jgi:hypothetical protein
MNARLSHAGWATYYHAEFTVGESLMTRTTAIVALLLLAPVAHAAEGWRFGAAGEIVQDDNATRGIYDGKKSDTILAVEGSASRSFLLSETSGALLRATARYSHYADLRDLSNLALIGRAAWRYQPRREFGAPWLEVAGQGQYLRHADSELRDGTIWSVDASVGSYLTDRTRVSGGLGLDQRSGGGTAGLYDLSQNRIWGTLDLRVGVRNTLYGRLTRLGGDQVFSSGSESGLSAVWEDDPALRAPLGLAVANSYRIEATTFIYEFGFNYPLGPAQALDVSVARYDAKIEEGSAEGRKYGATLVRAAWLYRFQ